MKWSQHINEWLSSGSIIAAKDGNLILGWGKRSWRQEPDDTRHSPQFYFPDFFLQNMSPWFEDEFFEIISPNDLLGGLDAYKKTTRSNELQSGEWSSANKAFFYKTFEQLQKRFVSGELIKAVPFATKTFSQKMSLELLLNSVYSLVFKSTKHAVYPYGFWNEEEGILGATPEILCELTPPNHLYTMACAGTGNAELLMSDTKERHEHQIVVDGMRESLSPYGKVSVGEIKVLHLSTLNHLLTPIHVLLNERHSINEIIRALHPTPALGAFPRESGMQWLREYQIEMDRKRFGASVGYLLPGSSEAMVYVAIRNIQWDLEKIWLTAGCGVVPESNVDCEWNEIHFKFDFIKDMLAL